MTREEKIKDIARHLERVLAENEGSSVYERPDRELAIRFSGTIDLLKLAEWLYVRML